MLLVISHDYGISLLTLETKSGERNFFFVVIVDHRPQREALESVMKRNNGWKMSVVIILIQLKLIFY